MPPHDKTSSGKRADGWTISQAPESQESSMMQPTMNKSPHTSILKPPRPFRAVKKQKKKVSFAEETVNASTSSSSKSLRMLYPEPTTSENVDLLKDAVQSSIRRHGYMHSKVGNTYNNLGNWFFRKGDWTSACNAYKSAAYCCQVGLHTADAFANLGAVYWRTGELDKAKPALQCSLDFYARFSHLSSKTQLLVANVHHQLGLVYSLQGDFPNAIAALHRALFIRELYGTAAMVAKTMDAMGQINCLAKNYDSAIRWYTQANTKSRTVSILENLAWTYREIGDLKQAARTYHDVLYEQRKSYNLAVLEDLHPKKREAALRMGHTLKTMLSLFIDMNRSTDATNCQDELAALAKREKIAPSEFGLDRLW